MKTEKKKAKTAQVYLPGDFPKMLEEIKDKDRHFNLSNTVQTLIKKLHTKHYPQ